ncbi:MAG: 2,3-bisphosphoglycerate-independent phosphoglycerate mutase [Alphaproteobacteria bacterium]|nr:2,3-bisphosphoglycerate-independent phosphoglycerate mutase [Alphaproteobacteria bacterium]
MSKVLLCILDGVGIYKDYEGNAYTHSNTPNLDRIFSSNPYSHIEASGEFVGLPAGQMGNSEVGHMNIGAGRVVEQLLPRIENSIKNNSLKDDKNLEKLVEKTKASGDLINVMGLLSSGGIHSHIRHITYLCQTLADKGLQVNLHVVTDGRDTPQESAIEFIKEFEDATSSNENIKIATLSGRFYAMDRNNNQDRTDLTHDTLLGKKSDAKRYTTATEAIEASYKEGVTDEFVVPCLIGDYEGMKDGESFIFANFRSDRARQICSKFLNSKDIKLSALAGMADYSAELSKSLITLFPDLEIKKTLGEVVAENGLSQLRIAETEKYAHVTFFLNGGEETEFKNEDRILVESPRVETYDQAPDMSAKEITEKLTADLDTQKHDVIILNYANGDMLGHTGNMDATEQSVETVDACVAELEKKCKENGYHLMITADHGNCEIMINEETGKPHTAHTCNVVPFSIIEPTENKEIKSLSEGALCDVAPTILEIVGITQPTEMTGKSLIKK